MSVDLIEAFGLYSSFFAHNIVCCQGTTMVVGRVSPRASIGGPLG